MTGSTILGRRRVPCAFPPIFCHFAVAFQADGRLPHLLIGRMLRAMPAVTGIALQTGYRFMLYLVPAEGGFDVLMASEADTPRLVIHELGFIRAVRFVAEHAFTVGERWMGRIRTHCVSKFLVTVEAEFTVIRSVFEEVISLTAMGGMARRALSPAERLMDTE